MRIIAILALAACTGEPTVETPEPAPIVAPAPAPADPELTAVVDFEVDAAHDTTLAGSPALAASWTASLESLRRASPVGERVERVSALRAKAMSDVPAEDGSSVALREAYDAAIAEALGAFFLAYAHHILQMDTDSETKGDQLELLEAALLKSGWDWDLASRDDVQAKLMMARSAG